MFQPAALRNAISWGGNGPGCAGGSRGGRGAASSPQLVFWSIDGTFAIKNSGAIRPKPPCHKPYIGPSIFSAAPSTLVGLTVYSPRTRFWTCPVAGLSVIRAEGLKANRPMLRYLRVEELAALSRARRSAYCARGSLQLEGVHDPTMPRLWRQQPCPCQTSV